MVSLIVAHDDELIIGKAGGLPWHISDDLKYFKRVTMGCPIIMGRKTYESIGWPLPGRLNIVVSGTLQAEHIHVVSSLKDAIALAQVEQPDKDVFVIGGAGLYKEALNLVHRLYITYVQGTHDGDVHFPEYRKDIGKKWIKIQEEAHDGYSFIVYERN